MDAVLTMWPGCFWAIMRGTKASTPWMTPQRLTPIAHSQSRWVADSSPPQRATPALLHSTWTPPISVERAVGERLHVVEPAHVGLDGDGRAARPGHVRDGLGHAGLVEVGDHHVGALAREGRQSARPMPLAPPVTTRCDLAGW